MVETRRSEAERGRTSHEWERELAGRRLERELGSRQRADAIMRRMDRSVGWRAALLQAFLLAVVAVALAAALPRSFFEDWGWLAGPAAWGGCALAAGAALRLPLGLVVVGAALSGLPMLIGVAVGVHWLGAPLGLTAFGAWCGWLAARRPGMPVAA